MAYAAMCWANGITLLHKCVYASLFFIIRISRHMIIGNTGDIKILASLPFNSHIPYDVSSNPFSGTLVNST
jgi:hypothetical protein